MKYLLTFIAGALVLGGGVLYGMNHQAATQKFGTFNPTGGGTYYLQSAINNTQTTVALSSFTEPGTNIPYTMTYLNSSLEYATINPIGPGNSTGNKSEFISFSGITQNSNGTALLTGVVRGLSRSYPYTASSTQAYSQPGQTQLILSAPPQFYNQFYTLQNNATSSGILTFGSTTPPQYDADPTWANFSGRILADINYVNSVVAGGAANASETVKGIVQLATIAQASLGTSIGSTGARLGLGANLASSTPDFLAAVIPVTGSNGKLTQTFLDLTQAFNFSATTTLACSNVNSNACIFNSLAYRFPSARGASSTMLAENGSGVLTWEPVTTGFIYGTTSQVIAGGSTASSTVFVTSVPGNSMGTGNVLDINIPVSSIAFGQSAAQYIEVGYGTASTTATLLNTQAAIFPATGIDTGYINVRIIGAGATNSQKVNVSVNASNSSVSIAGAFSNMTTKAIATDSTVTQPLTVIVRSNAVSGSTFTTEGATVQIIK